MIKKLGDAAYKNETLMRAPTGVHFKRLKSMYVKLAIHKLVYIHTYIITSQQARRKQGKEDGPFSGCTSRRAEASEFAFRTAVARDQRCALLAVHPSPNLA